MFDIGFWELIVIAVLGLFILGPERLPGAIHSMIKSINSLKRAASQVTTELQQEVNLKKIQDDIKLAENNTLSKLNQDIQKSVDSLKEQASDIKRPYQELSSSVSKQIEKSVQPSEPKDD